MDSGASSDTLSNSSSNWSEVSDFYSDNEFSQYTSNDDSAFDNDENLVDNDIVSTIRRRYNDAPVDSTVIDNEDTIPLSSPVFNPTASSYMISNSIEIQSISGYANSTIAATSNVLREQFISRNTDSSIFERLLLQLRQFAQIRYSKEH
ncbi:hypothetical protein GJ496_005565 [Pomphorhynchus laevis]|nr:hypothetical protein GJ496_005565 [Pomphorhynchus laevis]